MSICRQLLLGWVSLQVLACANSLGAPQGGNGTPDAGKSARRIVHQFDFDERSEGNLEELPRYWTLLHGEKFPRFSRGGFDDKVGRSAPPSFHVESKGRNVAFQYDGPEIPVRPESEYRIEGFIRTTGMSAARVCVSAQFLDGERRALLATSRRTQYIAQPPGVEWGGFELQLPSAPEGAEFLGLVVWILQDADWNLDQPEPHVSLVDVNAAAWFDDISVYRLPRVEVTTRTPGEILDEHGDIALWVTLADSLDQRVAAELTLMSVDGTEIMRRELQGSIGEAQASRIDLSGLEPGLYSARVEVIDQGKVIISRSVQFLRQASLGPGANRQARSFGIVIDAKDRADLEVEAAVLKNHAARSVKLPVWPEMQGMRDGSHGERSLEQYYHELAVDQFLLTGALCGPPARLPSGSRNADDALLAVLASERSSWEADISAVAARTAGLFQCWQIGVDGRSMTEPSGPLEEAVGQLRNALREFTSVPRIALPISANDKVRNVPFPVEQVTVAVENMSDLWQLRERIKTLKGQGYESVSAYVPPLSPDRFAREARLAEWARRILEARHAGADVVYVPQPWQGRTTLQGTVVEPVEEYLLLRTIAALLGDAKPGPAVPVADQVQCLTFRGASQATIAMWDDAPPPGGRTVAIQLGTASRQVDLWGRSTPLQRDDSGRHLVTISSTPVLIDQVEPWVIDLAASLSMEPAVIESGSELVRQEIVLDCASAASMSGHGMLVPPPGIGISPRQFSFTACAGEPVRIPVQVRYPHNEPAGEKKFIARITRVDPADYFEIPFTVEIRMSDIEVSGRAMIERGDLLLRHTLRNQSQSVVSFRSIAGVPGQQRQYRPVSNLGPGETQTLEYRFHDATNLIGRRVNLALRELNDGPRQHNLELTVP